MDVFIYSYEKFALVLRPAACSELSFLVFTYKKFLKSKRMILYVF